MIALVSPEWSPFYSAEAPSNISSLAIESRALMFVDPARVAEVLSKENPQDKESVNLIRGLSADAYFFIGGDFLLEAKRSYRSISLAEVDAATVAWAQFMLGTIDFGIGLQEEAEQEFKQALQGPHGPWMPALIFNLALLELDSGRPAEARSRLHGWLESYSHEPGKPLVLFLLGEAEMLLENIKAASSRFEAALKADRDAWLHRPEIGYALVDLLLKLDRPEDAVLVLGRLVESRPGTITASRALLAMGAIWAGKGETVKEAEAYARLLDDAPTTEESAEAMLRMALLGARHNDRIDLVEPYPAYKIFYRPAPTLVNVVNDRNPLMAQRALRGLSLLARREGAERKALMLLARAFKEYPESIESGRAYEDFMTLLENHLNSKLSESAYADVVEVYEGLKGPMGWAPDRDTGALSLSAGKAYGSLGAPSSARRVFEEIRQRGSRSVPPEEVDIQILGAKAMEGDAEAAKQWAEARKNSWEAQVFLADKLAVEGDLLQARMRYKKAAGLTSNPIDKLSAMAQADRLVVSELETNKLLAALRSKEDVWTRLPPGPERVEWEAHGRITEARLKFALGDYGGAAKLLRPINNRSFGDTYVLALAEKKLGRMEKSAELFAALVKADDPVYAGLAGLHLEIENIKNAERKTP